MANWLNSFLHPEEGYEKAEDAARSGYNESRGYEMPFRQGGLDQYGRLNEATGNLLDPESMLNKWASGYEESPWAKRETAMNSQLGEEEASRMGIMGSSAAINNIQQGAGDIMQKDRREYLNDLMDKYIRGIGLGQSLYGTGASAGANLGGRAFQQGENMAGLEYGRQMAPGEQLGKILGWIGNRLLPDNSGGGGAGQMASMFGQ